MNSNTLRIPAVIMTETPNGAWATRSRLGGSKGQQKKVIREHLARINYEEVEWTSEDGQPVCIARRKRLAA